MATGGQRGKRQENEKRLSREYSAATTIRHSHVADGLPTEGKKPPTPVTDLFFMLVEG